MIDFMTLAKALPYVGPLMETAVEVKDLIHQVIGGFSSSDQTILQQMLVDIAGKNDRGHEDIQRELGEAEKK